MNCYFDAVGQTPFVGHVTRTANAIDPTTRTLLTEVQVPNPNGRLLPGMFTRAVFLHLRAEPPVIVPSDSIIARANGITIAVVQDGIVHIRKVSIGRDYGAQTEVLSGVNPGELVIINPTDAAQEGARVKPHELKQGLQPGAAPANPQGRRAADPKGPEPGSPGELQGPGPHAAPRPDYGPYSGPLPSQSVSGSPAGNAAGGTSATSGPNSTNAQPH